MEDGKRRMEDVGTEDEGKEKVEARMEVYWKERKDGKMREKRMRWFSTEKNKIMQGWEDEGKVKKMGESKERRRDGKMKGKRKEKEMGESEQRRRRDGRIKEKTKEKEMGESKEKRRMAYLKGGRDGRREGQDGNTGA